MFESSGGFIVGIAYPLPSFPRKRESSGGLSGMRRHKAAPFGIPAYAGMTVETGGGNDGRRREGRFLYAIALAGIDRGMGDLVGFRAA